MKTYTQVVVIGGGVVGASVLYHLTKIGWTDVMLLEKHELTSGSTWHAAGGVHTYNSDANVSRLQKYTIDLYHEIERINFADYTRRFLLPYLLQRGLATNRADLVAATDLEKYTDALHENPKVRVQFCDDDFVLTPEDIAWFRSTFGDRRVEYQSGGHLGNLYLPTVQENLVKQFSDHLTK